MREDQMWMVSHLSHGPVVQSPLSHWTGLLGMGWTGLGKISNDIE